MRHHWFAAVFALMSLAGSSVQLSSPVLAQTSGSQGTQDTTKVVDLEAQVQGEILGLLARGRELTKQRRPKLAIQTYQRAVGLADVLGYQRMSAAAHLGLGRNFNVVGERKLAETHFRAAIPHLNAINDHSAIADTLFGLGSLKQQEGNVLAATSYYQQALEAYESMADSDGIRATQQKLTGLEPTSRDSKN
ncbi:MAG: tetratricopeptide repeat protein [Cyanobacteria bacterium P01_H01_bin.15]